LLWLRKRKKLNPIVNQNTAPVWSAVVGGAAGAGVFFVVSACAASVFANWPMPVFYQACGNQAGKYL